jgi:hypothetical protein
MAGAAEMPLAPLAVRLGDPLLAGAPASAFAGGGGGGMPLLRFHAASASTDATEVRLGEPREAGMSGMGASGRAAPEHSTTEHQAR